MAPMAQRHGQFLSLLWADRAEILCGKWANRLNKLANRNLVFRLSLVCSKFKIKISMGIQLFSLKTTSHGKPDLNNSLCRTTLMPRLAVRLNKFAHRRCIGPCFVHRLAARLNKIAHRRCRGPELVPRLAARLNKFAHRRCRGPCFVPRLAARLDKFVHRRCRGPDVE